MFFDAHADILTDMYQESKKQNHNSFKKRHLESYKKAGITHSIFVNWTNPQTKNETEFVDIFDASLTELANNSDIFNIVTNNKNLTVDGKINVIIGIEGVMQLQDLTQLRELYKKGVRHASLTWNEVNKYAGGLSDFNHGLTLLGKELLHEMEQLGMIIDLAHSNPITFDHILSNTTGPIIISHGNVKAKCDHIRNYTNEQLLKIKERNGVIGICGIPAFISETKEKQTVSYLAEHIDYAVKLVGIDHVGIGLDVCYYLDEHRTEIGVDGFQTIADANNIFIELEKLGYTQDQINKIKYENFLRVTKEVLK